MNIRCTLSAFVCLLALSLTAGAQQPSASSLTIEAVLAAAETANPELAALALQRENARVTFDRASASSDARLVQTVATLQWQRAQLNVRQGTVRELLAIAQAYVDLQQANAEVTAELNLAAARNQRRFTTLPNLMERSGLGIAVLDAAALTSERPEPPDLETSETYATATARRAEHRHAAQQLEIDEINLKLLSEEETSRLDLEAASNTVGSSRATLEDTAVDLQTATASAYATARQAFGTVTLRELQLALQQERTRRTEEQFTAGVVTQSGLDAAQADLAGSVNTLRAARWSAWFAWLRLQDAAGLDLPAIPGME